MIAKPLFESFLPKYLPLVKRILTRLHYDYVSQLDRHGLLLFMNYGYHDAGFARAPLHLSPPYDEHRYQVQLYHHIANTIPWRGLNALEVGSGRGGGASYLAGAFQPGSMIGMDLSPGAIEFCRRNYSVPGLSFQQGNAESLPFPDNAFDIVLNVESAQDYPRVQRFYDEVVRVLRPGGHFLYADLRYWEQMEGWRRQLAGLPLELVSEQDITPHVLQALELDHSRKSNLVTKHAPRLLQSHFGDFAGLTGAGLYRQQPHDGDRLYMNFVFRKAALL